MNATLLCLLVVVASATAITISGGAALNGKAVRGSLTVPLLPPWLQSPSRPQPPRGPLNFGLGPNVGRPGGRPPLPGGPPSPGGPPPPRPGGPPPPRPGGPPPPRPGGPPPPPDRNPWFPVFPPHHHGRPHHPRPPFFPPRASTTSATTESTTASTTTASTTTASTTTEGSTAASTTTEGSTTASTTTEGSTAASTTTEGSTTASTTTEGSTTASTTTEESTSTATDGSTSSTDSETSTSTETGSTESSTGSSTDSSRQRRQLSFSFGSQLPSNLNVLPDVNSMVSAIPNLGSITSAPAIAARPDVSTLPRIPGLQHSIEHAREIVVKALGGGANLGTAVHDAMDRALDDPQPANALGALFSTILNAYYIVALKCPLIVVGSYVFQEGLGIVLDIIRALDNISFEAGVTVQG